MGHSENSTKQRPWGGVLFIRHTGVSRTGNYLPVSNMLALSFVYSPNGKWGYIQTIPCSPQTATLYHNLLNASFPHGTRIRIDPRTRQRYHSSLSVTRIISVFFKLARLVCDKAIDLFKSK